MALSYIGYLLKTMNSLRNNFYIEYIFNILGNQVVKFDSAGVLVSRDIRLQPSPSRPFIVYSFCLGVVTSQYIHFRGSLPPTDCASL